MVMNSAAIIAAAPVPSLARELPHAGGMAKNENKKQKPPSRQNKKNKNFIQSSSKTKNVIHSLAFYPICDK